MRDRREPNAAQNQNRKRRTVLLTGASGVVGQALLERLTDVNIICLVHNTPVPDPGIVSIRGDITQSRLGLAAAAYRELADGVDAVIHCAAVTDFYKADGSLEATNIDGTVNVATFALAADAVMYHVSTAFRDAQAVGSRGCKAGAYAASKRSGEDAVRASGVRHVILRPSIVIGDSRTGSVAAFQGIHQVAGAIAADSLPMIPFHGEWSLDFVPCDYVADAIATVLENRVSEGEFWITAGPQALRLDESVSICLTMVRDLGAEVSEPRFVPPELFDRLIGPVFLDALPRRMKYTVNRLLEFFAIYLAAGRQLPNSHDELAAMGAAALPDQRQSLQASLDYWMLQSGFSEALPVREVA